MNLKKKSFILKIAVVILLFILFLNGRIAEPFLRLIGKPNRIGKDTVYKTSVPVLMYHSVSNNKKGIFTVSTDKFRKQMEYIKNNDYKTLTLDELHYYISNDKVLPDKAVIITFDDGYKDNYKNAYPVLKEYGLKATIFVIADYVRDSSFYLDLKELREMYNNGIDIQCHTLSHEKLDKLSYDRQLMVLSTSKSRLEKLMGKDIKYIAYPFGRYNKDTIKCARKAGYEMAFTTRMGYCTEDEELFKVRRICVPGFIGLNMFKKILY